MKDPMRLRDIYEGNAFGEAFRSADDDAPPRGSRKALLTALGVTTTATIASGSAAAGGVASGAAGTVGASVAGAGAGGAPLLAKIAGASLVTKLLVGSALVVTGSVAAVSYNALAPSKPDHSMAPTVAATVVPAATPTLLTTGTRPVAKPVPPPAPIAQLVTAPTGAPTVAATGMPDPLRTSTPRPPPAAPATILATRPVDATSTATPSIAPPSPPDPQPTSLPPPAHAGGVPSLAPELAALERARGLLNAGRASEALTALDAYGSNFPRGMLGQEAEVLRIDALVRSGQRGAADARARAFLARLPQSPQAARIRALLGMPSGAAEK